MIDKGLVCKIWDLAGDHLRSRGPSRENLPAELIEDVTAAIEGLPEADPEGFHKLYSSFTEEDVNPSVGFVRVDQERYQWIVDMRQWIKEQRRGG